MATGISFDELNHCVLKTIQSFEKQTGKQTLYVIIPDYIFHTLQVNPGIYWPASSIHGLYIEASGFVIVPEDDKRFEV